MLKEVAKVAGVVVEEAEAGAVAEVEAEAAGVVDAGGAAGGMRDTATGAVRITWTRKMPWSHRANDLAS